MLLICCGYRVSIDFWLFPSSLRLVCIYITSVLCQQNLFLKNLAQSKARIEPHTAWILNEIVPVNTRGSRAEIWLLHEGLACQPVSFHCFTSACFSPDWEWGLVCSKALFATLPVVRKAPSVCSETFSSLLPAHKLWDENASPSQPCWEPTLGGSWCAERQ